MAQINLPHTLVAGTPENINDVQDNFVEIKDHINNALVGDDNLTSPNNSVPRTIHSVGGSFLIATMVAGTYVLIPAQQAIGSVAGMYQAPVWVPNTADFAVAGKTAQVRLVAYLLVNATAPAVNFTAGVSGISVIAGAGANSMSFTLAASFSLSSAFTTPAANSATRVASSWVNLSLFSANSYCLAVTTSGTIAANSTVSISAAIEMRHT